MAFWQGLFLFSVTVGLAWGDLECPPLWTRYGGNCYRFFGLGKPWADAEAHCQQFFTRYGQGHLASIHNSGENGFLYELWKTSVDVNSHVWIGLTDEEVEEQFKWTDKTAFNYNDWQVGQPSNWANLQHCVEVRMNTENNVPGWNDDSCTEDNLYICKMPTAE